MRTYFAHPASRILIVSLLFAFAHDNPEVMPQFIQGLAWGVLFERHGLLATSIGHTMGNIFKHTIYGYPQCQSIIRKTLSITAIFFEQIKNRTQATSV